MATNKDKNTLFRTFKSEGKTYHTFNNKLHNWDGPAIHDDELVGEYYLYGLQYSKHDWSLKKNEIERGYSE